MTPSLVSLLGAIDRKTNQGGPVPDFCRTTRERDAWLAGHEWGLREAARVVGNAIRADDGQQMTVAANREGLAALIEYSRVMANKLYGEYSNPDWKVELEERVAALALVKED